MRAVLAGDLEQGVLLLEESADRVSISGIWKDTSRSAPDDAPGVPFTLTRLP